MIVTVTLNAALDRTLTVPNFQLGHRHRASAAFTLAGGKGINVARALKALDVPVVATGLVGGRTGMRIVEELTGEAILNDFVRIAQESRTSTMVVDPTGGTSTEIYEWGPQVSRDELEMLLEKIAYLARAADTRRALRLAAARASSRTSTRTRSASSTAAACATVLDTEGEPLRLGVEAEPWLVSPNQREAEGLVGQEFHDEEDFLMALDAIAELGARNVLIGHGAGAFALFREERRTQRFEAQHPAARAARTGRRGRRDARRLPRRARRRAVARGGAALARSRRAPRRRSRSAAAASTPRDVSRLVAGRDRARGRARQRRR